MGGSAGGFGNIREVSQPEVKSWFQSMLGQENAFQAQDPNLQGGIDVSQQSLKDLPGLQKQLQGYSNELGGYKGQLGDISQQLGRDIGGYRTQLGNLSNYAGGLYAADTNQIGRLQSYLGGAGGIDDTIARHGALSAEAQHQADQQAAALAAQGGTAHSVGTVGSQLLNREQYQQNRFNQAYQQGLAGQQAITGVRGQQSGLLGQQGQFAQAGAGLASGLAGQQAGLTQGQAAITGQQGGMLNQFQNLAGNVINQLTGARNAVTQNFTPLMSLAQAPVLANLQSRIEGASINAQGGAADDAKRAGLISSGIKALGSVAGGAAMSDERLKTRVRNTGLETLEGIPLKTWEYKTDPGVRYLSATAQDVEKVKPEAVLEDPLSKVKFVDFSKLSVGLVPIKAGG